MTRFAGRPGLAAAVWIATMLWCGVAAAAAQSPPTVTGFVNVGLLEGSLEGKVCLAGIPAQGDTIALVLNSALRINAISGVRPAPVRTEGEPGGAAYRYWFSGATPRPSGSQVGSVADVCISFGGVETVYRIDAGEYRASDQSHLIAFNGRTIRARGASRWLPTPYHELTGLATEAILFDLEVRCPECRLIYMNGAGPIEAPIGTFRAGQPREPLLVAGTLSITPPGSPLTIIGEALTPGETEVLREEMERIRSFLEWYVDVPFGPLPTLVRLEPVRPPREGVVWGFYSDPALTLMGLSLADVAAYLQGPRLDRRRTLVAFLTHEMGHRYFGWRVGPESAQRDLFGEPFATFLELKAVATFFGPEEYDRQVDRLRERVLNGPESTPLVASVAVDFAADHYRYAYVPALLLTLESAIGPERMRRVVHHVATAPADEVVHADFGLLRIAALRAGVGEEEWREWEARCVTPPVSASTCLEELNPGEFPVPGGDGS